MDETQGSVPITKDFGFLPIPSKLRHDPAHPAKFSIILNVTFGFGSTFIVSNLYYCQPILIQLSHSFGVTYTEVSNIPTLIQAGYAVGLLFLSPLGDLIRRRPLILLLVFCAGAFTIPLAITKSLAVFEAMSFLVGVFTVAPMVLMPLAADLAPPERKASAISVVLSGLLLGILLARVLAGIIAQFASWRVVYYMAIGAQAAVFALFYFVLPDYPARNQDLTYFRILYTMAKFTVTEPLLIQACLIQIASSAMFTSFWVTLTFLLGGPPLDIGLFGLAGMFGVAMGPILGRITDRLIPWYATLVATLFLTVAQAIQTGAGGINVGAVIVTCFGIDSFRQMQQVSLTTAVWAIDPSARARLNAVLVISIFIGQVMGTSVGTKVFVDYGWRAAAGLSMAFCGWELAILLLRGPHCERHTWIGWEGGWEARQKVIKERQQYSVGETDLEGGVPPVGKDSPRDTLAVAQESEPPSEEKKVAQEESSQTV
ncbi:MFS general substrate transporter [Gloeophyllum trabeum ATCC 11539]|uniref:MFS general substrate transporter n=1 Tax=Gloeophyllum trabeum (strain ATCC 11539 / FP-39264 / Madison 617) TaxID=670483 RepID=S7S083_GLOTA|nr:MFS general substrate transporter [Gloeophyllum trabeum ATCC 11539]EPQ60755.1 MFS general substrate transporter [Gloeophyllum trabeum ATCC 11539]